MSAFVVIACEAEVFDGTCGNWIRGGDEADLDAARASAAAAGWTRTPDGTDRCRICSSLRPRLTLDIPDRGSQ
ncbi:hypothetical protein [Nonomuraea rubra]|uniref:hypothetical protein n=1 Tax=Nonomuraea rubra TaxID=46180 RepID=UPI003408F15C